MQCGTMFYVWQYFGSTSGGWVDGGGYQDYTNIEIQE